MNKIRTKKLRDAFITKWASEHPNNTDDYKLKIEWRRFKKQWKQSKRNGEFL